MSSFAFFATGIASALSAASIGGGLYEFVVVDPVWPRQPEIVQPAKGGISRKHFWIPAHVAFELALVAALIIAWQLPEVRFWLLVALASHALMRIWSAFDFIPKALAFEKADARTIDPEAARRWTRRSMLRLPLDVVTAFSMLAAFAAAARII